jgi:hypothetical protein
MNTEKSTNSDDIRDLKRSLEDAMLLTSVVKLALMNPDLDSRSKDIYEKSHKDLNVKMRYLKIMIMNAQEEFQS